MNNFRLLSFTMALLASVFTITACGGDDDDDNNNGGGTYQGQIASGLDEKLVGSWTCIVSEGWEYNANATTLVHWKDLSVTSTERWEYDDNGKQVSHNTYNEPDKPEWETLTLNPDGTYTDINEDGNQPNGTWKAANGTLSLTVRGVTVQYPYHFDGNALIITEEVYEQENGRRFLASKTIDRYERGTFNTKTNTIDHNGSYVTNNTKPDDDEPAVNPNNSFPSMLIGVWKSYKITINGTDEVYYVQDKNDEAYAEFEFTDYGTARYSFWDDGEESNARALIKRVMSKASQASTFTSIPLSYQINGYTVYVYERTSGVGLTLNYNQSEKALVLSSDITGDEGQVYTFNLFFRK